MGVVEALSAGFTSGMVTSMIPPAFMLIVLMTGQLGSDRFAGDRP
jgi:branched-chain amino acid transport system permease protein